MIAAAEILRAARLMPVLTVERAEDAVPLAQALLAGGLTHLEVTLRTAAALDAIAAMARVPGVVVGAGTVLEPADLQRAAKAGARFALSPGATNALLEAGQTAGIPFIPGIGSASELMAARAAGYRAVKVFPAEPLGGTSFIKSLVAPIPDMTLCPTGGITPALVTAYKAIPQVACVGGSWMAPGDAIKAGDWARITALCAV
jgi:2-dehydro-3-deoxyphosphogluconate aldolase / (4S)-4-hydroxy-2-oxoglutarate aldolase